MSAERQNSRPSQVNQPVNDEASSDEELVGLQLESNRQVNSDVAITAGATAAGPTVTDPNINRPTEESTAREERLARKLKTIDSVTSPKSSFDVKDEELNESRKVSVKQVSVPVRVHPNPAAATSFARSSSSAFNPALTRPTFRMAATVSSVSRHGMVVSLPERVTLIVDGTRFLADPQIFLKMPDTMLGRSVLPKYREPSALFPFLVSYKIIKLWQN